MTDQADTKTSRIKNKIAASQVRLHRDAPPSAESRPLRDGYPPKHVSTLAAQYPLLTLAAGALAGVALGALLPRTLGRKFSRRAVTVLTIAGELGLAASRRARDAAGEAGPELRLKAGQVAGGARSKGLSLAREAIKLAARARR